MFDDDDDERVCSHVIMTSFSVRHVGGLQRSVNSPRGNVLNSSHCLSISASCLSIHRERPSINNSFLGTILSVVFRLAGRHLGPANPSHSDDVIP